MHHLVDMHLHTSIISQAILLVACLVTLSPVWSSASPTCLQHLNKPCKQEDLQILRITNPMTTAVSTSVKGQLSSPLIPPWQLFRGENCRWKRTKKKLKSPSTLKVKLRRNIRHAHSYCQPCCRNYYLNCSTSKMTSFSDVLRLATKLDEADHTC